MSRYSRRGFLGGLLGVLAGWLGARVKPAEAAPVPATTPAGEQMVSYCDSGGSVTTYTYDGSGRLVATMTRDAPGAVTTYCYDARGNFSRVKPPPPRPPRGTDNPPVA
jgi:YD repeat-containing protein